MPTDSFEKTNFQWQIQQLGRQIEEWFALQIPKIPAPKGVAIAPWFLEAVFWVVMPLAVAWLSWQLFNFLRPYFSPFQSRSKQASNDRTPAQTPDLTVAGWLRRAQEQQQRGNYREACRSLYLATLQRLNDTSLLPHQFSRTDGEYRQFIQTLPQPHLYEVLIGTHEQLCFSNTQISAEEFDRCQQAYQEIERQ